MSLDEYDGGDLLSRLSPREQQILEQASRGMTNAQMAEELAVTTHAIKFHLAQIYRKLGAANRTDAAARYVKAMR
jgi:DNA-binding NarL/FixJ family response regulator